MIPAFQYYFPNVIDGINQKHLKLSLLAVPCRTEEFVFSKVPNKLVWPKTEIKPKITEIKTTETKNTEIKPKTTETKPKITETKTKTTETNEIEIMIDDKYLGKIIGRGGYMIDQIRTNSNTKITIYRELYNSKRRVVICGNQDCIQKAKTNILQLCC